MDYIQQYVMGGFVVFVSKAYCYLVLIGRIRETLLRTVGHPARFVKRFGQVEEHET